ncbi:hypothetical protein [Glycomyces salinus]|uniref:hypothetical protein n=1 Tax=Glycomyces salinus TaxID=980294 RepID=UPI0018EAE3EB|nr:hypothetical protein [Glycomyces salinus]
MAEDNRAAYLPELAMAVDTHANCLAEARRRGETLAAAEWAVAMREELIETNRTTHLPDLALSLQTAAHVRQNLGVELDAALEYCDRAIGYYRELSEAEPNAFSDDLATVEALRQTLIEQRDEPA